MLANTPTRRVLDGLDDVIVGSVVRRSEPGWDRARCAWNLAVEQHPAGVVQVGSAADVAATVRVAASEGRAVMAQRSGHDAARAGADGAVLLRTEALADVQIDAARRVARVGAGVTTESLLASLAGTGLTALCDWYPDAGVVGFLLGGGLSWFGRAYGPAAGAVRAVELVDAGGRPVRVTAGSDPELFWALRGGGADFGVVTAVELALLPAPELSGGRLMFPAEDARPVLEAAAELTRSAPRRLTVRAGVLRPPTPSGARYVVVDAVHLGAPGETEALLAPLRAAGRVVHDTVGPLPVERLPRALAAASGPMPVLSRSTALRWFDGVSLERLLDCAGPASGTPLAGFWVRQLGGALADAEPAFPGGIAAQLTAPYLATAWGAPRNPVMAEAVRAALGEWAWALAEDACGGVPCQVPGGPPAAQAYEPETLERLRTIKHERDPYGVFRSNRPVLGY